jgi:ATP synthase protein I
MNKTERSSLSWKIRAKAERKRNAKRKDVPGVWFGLGMMGLIGWSVTVPALIGAGLGLWLDKLLKGAYSWTLTLLLLGLMIGCLTAWNWVGKERDEMKEEEGGPDD